MNECLNGASHGSVHIEVGGVWNTPNLTSNSLINSKNMYDVLLMSKNLWRQGYMICPEICYDPFECECKLNEKATSGSSSYDILANRIGIMDNIDSLSEKVFYNESEAVYRIHGFTEDEEAAAWDTMLQTTLIKPGSIGEMYSSASPYDPLFWVIHGTVDRLLYYRRLVSLKGKLPFNNTWGYVHSDTPSDTQVVCDWGNINENTGLPVCEEGVCPGHNEFDYIPFGDFLDDDPLIYTNNEMYKFLGPENNELPYTYDNFAWSHCDAELYSFGMKPDGGFPDTFELPSKPSIRSFRNSLITEV